MNNSRFKTRKFLNLNGLRLIVYSFTVVTLFLILFQSCNKETQNDKMNMASPVDNKKEMETKAALLVASPEFKSLDSIFMNLGVSVKNSLSKLSKSDKLRFQDILLEVQKVKNIQSMDSLMKIESSIINIDLIMKIKLLHDKVVSIQKSGNYGNIDKKILITSIYRNRFVTGSTGFTLRLKAEGESSGDGSPETKRLICLATCTTAAEAGLIGCFFLPPGPDLVCAALVAASDLGCIYLCNHP